MGGCTSRGFLTAICAIQLVATVTRQVFDFLGFMWASIIGNFINILFAIIGLFGAVQYRPKAVLTYTVWNIIWLGLNIFVILLYLQPDVKIGLLAQLEAVRVMSIGVRDVSWWVSSGLSCSQAGQCLLQYHYIEIILAGVQCLLAFIGFLVSCYVIYVFTEDDDSYKGTMSSQPVNDELEYIKMRYKSPSTRTAGYSLDGPPYATLPPPSNYNTLQTTLNPTIDRSDTRPGRAVVSTTGTMERRRADKHDRQSVKSKPDSYVPPGRESLPWVHVTPSLTNHYPHTTTAPATSEMDEAGPPGYYQVMEQRAETRRTQYRRDKDSIII